MTEIATRQRNDSASPYVAELQQVSKTYGETVAIDAMDLGIRSGEFLSLLGPSGCGKTTTLRILGGFVIPDRGHVLLGGQDVTRVPPYRRSVNTVFQSYALFGHLNVHDNVAFGLRRRKVDAREVARRVDEVLEMVQLSGRKTAMPAQLSGGQQQRVALARAIINRPTVLLLDEPLAALDLKLRREMQVELKALQRELNITFVLVTHDQEEALSMSDRIGVMNHGSLQQLGQSREIYDHPASAFVAEFIGMSNLLPAVLDQGVARINGVCDIPLTGEQRKNCKRGSEITVSIRPEMVHVGMDHKTGSVEVPANVLDVAYLGASTKILLEIAAGLKLIAVEATRNGGRVRPLEPGLRTSVSWSPADVIALPRLAEPGAAGRPVGSSTQAGEKAPPSLSVTSRE